MTDWITLGVSGDRVPEPLLQVARLASRYVRRWFDFVLLQHAELRRELTGIHEL